MYAYDEPTFVVVISYLLCLFYLLFVWGGGVGFAASVAVVVIFVGDVVKKMLQGTNSYQVFLPRYLFLLLILLPLSKKASTPALSHNNYYCLC